MSAETYKTLMNYSYEKQDNNTYVYMCNNKAYKVIIGKNKHDNWKIIDESNSNDVWFHVDDHPSSHVIIRIDDPKDISKLDKKLIKFAAIKCKENSKVNSVRKLTIVYSRIIDIEKGEYTGQVIAHVKKTINV